jgi:transposase
MKVEKNMSVRAIAAEMNVPKSTVQDFLIEWKKKNPVSDIRPKDWPKNSIQQTRDHSAAVQTTRRRMSRLYAMGFSIHAKKTILATQ